MVMRGNAFLSALYFVRDITHSIETRLSSPSAPKVLFFRLQNMNPTAFFVYQI